jgi:hypothetical protein
VQFVNPIEVLALTNVPVAAIDSDKVHKTAAALLFAVENSNSSKLNYEIAKLNYSSAVSALSTKDEIAAYHFIAHHAALNNFLTTGDIRFLADFQPNPIYQHPVFIRIISPYFANAYNKALFTSYEEDGIATFSMLISISPLVTEEDKVIAYESLRSNIMETLETIAEVTATIDDSEFETDIAGLTGLLRDYLHIEKINLFPPYLYSLRNRIEKHIRALYNKIPDTYQHTGIFTVLDTYLQQIKTDEIPDIPKSAFQTASTQPEKELYAHDLQYYEQLRTELNHQLQLIRPASSDLLVVIRWVKKNINIAAINELPPVFDLFRNHLAMDINAMATLIFEKTRNAAAGIDYILLAEGLINLEVDTLKTLSDNKKLLQEYLDDPDFVSPAEKKNDAQGLVLILFIILVILRISFYFYTKSTRKQFDASAYRRSQDYNQNNVPPPPMTFETMDMPARLHTGHSPWESCYGNTTYKGNATLQFENGTGIDMVICLYNKQLHKTIRNAYVRSNDNFWIPGLKAGTYIITVYMGKDWTDAKQSECGTNGMFSTSVKSKVLKKSIVLSENKGEPLKINSPEDAGWKDKE